jgi:hypothetical protein
MSTPRYPLFAFCIAALLVLADSTAARAQYAPVGTHHGGWAAASGSSLGDAAQEVPLAFPPERDGLPVPVSLRSTGGSAVDAAGVGWTIPLSYVSVSDTSTHRRPRYRSDTSLEPGEIGRRVTLVRGGAPEAMVAIDNLGHYRPVLGDQLLELQELPDSFELLDGRGSRYRFEQLFGVGEGPYFLVSVQSSQRDQARVTLSYDVFAVAVGSVSRPEVVLSSVEYDYESTGTCGKYRIELEYHHPRDVTAAPVLADRHTSKWRT